MIFVTLQTKGGAGKSTVAQQILATYFLRKNEKVTLIEIDDENLDSSYMVSSSIKIEQLKFGTGSTAANAVETLITRTNENLVVDVGGNRTATSFIAEAGDTGFFDFVDLVVIPISASGQDEINAVNTAEMIENVAPGTKIAIIVTRQNARSDEEFDLIFTRYFDVPTLRSMTPHITYFPQVMAMTHSRLLETTLYEMANRREELTAQLSEKMIIASKSADKAKSLHYSRIRKSVQESGQMLPFIENCHRMIDSALS